MDDVSRGVSEETSLVPVVCRSPHGWILIKRGSYTTVTNTVAYDTFVAYSPHVLENPEWKPYVASVDSDWFNEVCVPWDELTNVEKGHVYAALLTL